MRSKGILKCKPTKEQLIEAANRLLNCFGDLDKWPKLSVAISKKTWYVAPVDDATGDAIRHLGKLTGAIRKDEYSLRGNEIVIEKMRERSIYEEKSLYILNLANQSYWLSTLL